MQIWLGKQRLDQRDKQEFIQQSDPLAELLAEFKKAHERGYVSPAVPEVTEENNESPQDEMAGAGGRRNASMQRFSGYFVGKT